MLYICPTPIGNLEDITIRTLNTFRYVDEIYCEDTRRTIKLLNYYEIKKPLYSLHEHNENIKSEEVIEKLKAKKNIAYVSDAGMPGISDPGSKLISKVIENGLEVTTLPGASAMIVALVNSGIDTRYFTFVGFLERDKNKQKIQLQELSVKKETLIIYESPHRINQTIKRLHQYFGDRKAVVAREISKKFEEYIRGSLGYLDENIQQGHIEILGEIIIILEGASESDFEYVDITDEIIIEHLSKKMSSGSSKKDATKEVAKELNISKNRVYEISITL